jgi:hypothetical protein
MPVVLPQKDMSQFQSLVQDQKGITKGLLVQYTFFLNLICFRTKNRGCQVQPVGDQESCRFDAKIYQR